MILSKGLRQTQMGIFLKTQVLHFLFQCCKTKRCPTSPGVIFVLLKKKKAADFTHQQSHPHIIIATDLTLKTHHQCLQFKVIIYDALIPSLPMKADRTNTIKCVSVVTQVLKEKSCLPALTCILIAPLWIFIVTLLQLRPFKYWLQPVRADDIPRSQA